MRPNAFALHSHDVLASIERAFVRCMCDNQSHFAALRMLKMGRPCPPRHPHGSVHENSLPVTSPEVNLNPESCQKRQQNWSVPNPPSEPFTCVTRVSCACCLQPVPSPAAASATARRSTRLRLRSRPPAAAGPAERGADSRERGTDRG